MDGKSFFYTNAMKSKTIIITKTKKQKRSGWFPCSCCPTNVAPINPFVPDMFMEDQSDLYVNLFIRQQQLVEYYNKDIQVIQENNYPWDGNLTFRINPNRLLRLIESANTGLGIQRAMPSTLTFLKRPRTKQWHWKSMQTNEFHNGQRYAVVNRTWKKGDVVELDLPMEVRKSNGPPKCKGRYRQSGPAKRTPYVCAEWLITTAKWANLILPETATFSSDSNLTCSMVWHHKKRSFAVMAILPEIQLLLWTGIYSDSLLLLGSSRKGGDDRMDSRTGKAKSNWYQRSKTVLIALHISLWQVVPFKIEKQPGCPGLLFASLRMWVLTKSFIINELNGVLNASSLILMDFYILSLRDLSIWVCLVYQYFVPTGLLCLSGVCLPIFRPMGLLCLSTSVYHISSYGTSLFE